MSRKKLAFTINLLWLYRNLGTEEDETPEELMSYQEFVEFVKKAEIYVISDGINEYLCIEPTL